jgi:hypothetical protein
MTGLSQLNFGARGIGLEPAGSRVAGYRSVARIGSSSHTH